MDVVPSEIAHQMMQRRGLAIWLLLLSVAIRQVIIPFASAASVSAPEAAELRDEVCNSFTCILSYTPHSQWLDAMSRLYLRLTVTSTFPPFRQSLIEKLSRPL